VKTITAAFRAHLNQDVTTLCTCWKVTRTDNAVFTFTDHDADISVGGVTYLASQGYNRTAIKSDVTMAVDNMDVVGILNSSNINPVDLKSGKFDYAAVEMFMLNWQDLSQGIMRLRRGWFGEVVTTPQGIFRAELRGLSQALITETTNVFTPNCKADLGDKRCKVVIKPDAVWTPGTTYSLGDVVGDSGAALPPDYALAAYRCTQAGTSGASPPAWNPAAGSVIPDNTAAWTTLPPLRFSGTVGTAVDKKTFIPTAPLSYASSMPGNTATAYFVTGNTNNVRFNLTDETQARQIDIPNNLAPKDAAVALVGLIKSYGLNVTAVALGHLVTITRPTGILVGKLTLMLNGSNNVIISNYSGNYLNGGVVTWATGLNTGNSMEIKTHSQDPELVKLVLNMPSAIQPGDVFYYYPGCDKRRKTCFFKFNNILNFRGEPDMPGTDTLGNYPDYAP